MIRALRRHWLVAIFLAAGLTLRILTQIAYRPALFYIDSDKYLSRSYGSDPVGYRVMLWPLHRFGGLAVVAGAQHILGLAMAVVLYLLLRRRGAPGWAAAIAAAPVLLDAYQLQAEQTLMPDVMFEALVVAGLAVLLWKPRPGAWLTAVAGLLLGAGTDVRQVGEVLILPSLLFILLAVTGWRRRIAHGALMTAAFAIPVIAYMTAADAVTGHFGITRRGVDILYGRSVFAADCAALRLPADERALCPPHAAAVRLGIDGIINKPYGPLRTYRPPAGMAVRKAKTDVEAAVMTQQPFAVPLSVGRDFVKLFALTRQQSPGDTPISRWQFQKVFPTYPPGITYRYVAQVAQGKGKPTVIAPLAVILRDYQLNGGYTPGPLLAVAGLTGLAGMARVANRRRGAGTALASACALVTCMGLVVLLASDFFQFSWRYQLPGLVTLPPAGALGVAALATGFRLKRRADDAVAPPAGEPEQPDETEQLGAVGG